MPNVTSKEPSADGISFCVEDMTLPRINRTFRKMKAIVYTKYGPPEVAKLMEVAKPKPKNNEVLIKVYFTILEWTFQTKISNIRM